MKYRGIQLWLFAIAFFSILSCTKEEVALSNLSELISFKVDELAIDFKEGADGNWSAKAQADDDLSELTAIFEVSAKASVSIGQAPQQSGVSKNNFTNPLIYTVRAEDGSKSNYTVAIYKEAAIVSYSILEIPDAEFTIRGNQISTTVPNGVDLEALTAEFEATENAKLRVGTTEQISGTTKNNFSTPLIYTLLEADGTEKNYTVSINKAANQPPVADAGGDKTYLVSAGETATEITLDGSASTDLEGPIASYVWKNGTEKIGATEVAKVTLGLGNHAVSLTVTDADGATNTDEITIVIADAGQFAPVDANATQTTKNLLKSLGNVAISEQVMFGQEFPLSFKLNGLRKNLSTSDCKEVSGDHPGIFGIDPHYMLYKTDEQKQIHINEAKKAYEGGAVVTFDFHQQSKNDHKIYMRDITTAEDKSLMYDIVNEKNGARAWFFDEMDQIIDIINNDLGFPVVFRIFHEMDGDWFWWGSAATNHSPQLYVDFYRLTADYFLQRSNLVLFAWSPNGELREEYYPGNSYVDVVGFDIYEPSPSDLSKKLIDLSNFSSSHNKVAALTETGYRNDMVNNAPGFWTDVILEAIKMGEKQIRIAWVLSWFNPPWESSQSALFIPDANSNQNAKDKFKSFKNDETMLFMEDVKALKMYE